MKDLIKNAYEKDAEVYVGGFGFLPPNPIDFSSDRIRKYASIFSLLLIVRFLLNRISIYPATVFFDLIGATISTSNDGYFVASSSTVLFIELIVSIVFFAGMLLVGYFLDRDFYKSQNLFKKFDKPFFCQALIITLTFWVVANVTAYILEDLFRLIGIINLPMFQVMYLDENFLKFDVVSLLVITFLQELFFRGIVLFRLREFGDRFAIFITSLLFAIYPMDLLHSVKWFILSLALSYFTIKSGSLLLAIAVRFICSFGLQFVQIWVSFLDADAKYAVFVLLGVASLLAGLLTFFKLDFHLYEPDDGLAHLDKSFIFVTNAFFVILVVITIFQAQEVLQFVG